MLQQFWQDLLATSALEFAAVLLGVAYVWLIVRRNRYGWIAGALSSVIYVWLSATARLPMQAVLQAYYVAMSGYGWWSWTRNQRDEQGRVISWTWPRHAVAAALILAVSLACAHWLAGQVDAAWPFIDSLTTVASLYATWLVTRSVLENWLYWIVVDSMTVFLYARQRHPFTALLYVSFLFMAALGYLKWRREYRAQQGPALVGTS